MDKVEIIAEEHPCNLEQIRVVEDLYELKFPEYYVEFLLSTNGGVMIPATVKMKFRRNPIYLDFFYSIGDIEADLEMRQENETYQLLMEDFRDDSIDQNPQELVPFAFTQRSGYFFINCGNNDFGSIYYVNMYGDGKLIKSEFIDIDDLLSSVVFDEEMDYENYITNLLAKRIYQFQETKYTDIEHERIYFKRFKAIISHIQNVELTHPQKGKLTDYYINNPIFLKHLLDLGANAPRNLEKLREEESREILTTRKQ